MTSSTSLSPAPAIEGTYKYEVQTLPLDLPKVPDRTLNQRKFDSWKVETAKTRQDREILKTVGDNIQHVSYNTFAKAVGDCVAKFQQKAPRKYISFVEPGKSQTWVTGIAVNQGLKPAMYLRIGEEGANMLPYTLQNLREKFPTVQNSDIVDIVRDIVIVDDGAFTGNQMSFNISSATGTLERFFGYSKNPFHFHVIIPFTTKQADKNILSAGKKKAKVHLYTSKNKMPVLSDVIKQKKDLQKSAKLLGVMESRVNSTALTYFDHKIPNSMSFPDQLARGGFIPAHESPYKQPPYILE